MEEETDCDDTETVGSVLGEFRHWSRRRYYYT